MVDAVEAYLLYRGQRGEECGRVTSAKEVHIAEGTGSFSLTCLHEELRSFDFFI
jgi:hypothetical protein